MTGDAVERVLDSILQERGGASMFSTHALAAASALAHALVLMAEGDLSRAPALGALTALLPPVVKPEDRFDFSLLSDREVALLECLLSRACGELPRAEVEALASGV